jgi:hypothetical protein
VRTHQLAHQGRFSSRDRWKLRRPSKPSCLLPSSSAHFPFCSSGRFLLLPTQGPLPTQAPCQTLVLGLPSLPGCIKTSINSHPNPSVSTLSTSLLLRHSFFSVALHRSALPFTRPIHSTAIRPTTQPETNSPPNPCTVSGSPKS